MDNGGFNIHHSEDTALECQGGHLRVDAGVIRAAGDPFDCFLEDPLRILQGCRLASQLGASIDASTLQAMRSLKMLLVPQQARSIRQELDLLLLGDHVHDALMLTIDVLVAVMPELASCQGFEQNTPYHIYDVWEHTAWVVQNSPAKLLTRWAALLHDIGKPAAYFQEGTLGHFMGHQYLSVTLAENILQRLETPQAFADQVLMLVRMHDERIAPNPRAIQNALVKLGGDVELFKSLCEIKRADALSQSDLARPRLQLADDLLHILEDMQS